MIFYCDEDAYEQIRNAWSDEDREHADRVLASDAGGVIQDNSGQVVFSNCTGIVVGPGGVILHNCWANDCGDRWGKFCLEFP